MRIAQIVLRAGEAVPPWHADIERMVEDLTNELVRAGHEVMRFARRDADPASPAQVATGGSRFDIVHVHAGCLPVPEGWRPCEASLMTVHDRPRPLDASTLEPSAARRAHDARDRDGSGGFDVPLVAVTRAQRAHAPDVNWQATVPYGVSRDRYTFRERPGDYLAVLDRRRHGQDVPGQDIDCARTIARRAGLPLTIVADDDGDERNRRLGGALALLCPSDASAPSGRALMEALACGTPVVTWPHDVALEVMEDEVTGYIVESVEQAVLAVGVIGELSRAKVRRVFEARFDASRMAGAYIDLYRRLLARDRGSPPRPHEILMRP